MPDEELLAFIRGALPSPPAAVLEVGAGGGEVAAALEQDGYEVVAVDPASKAPNVIPVALLELERAAAWVARAVDGAGRSGDRRADDVATVGRW